MTSGYRLEADENCTQLGYYAVSSGNLLPTFRLILSVTSSRVKVNVTLADGTGCPETSAKNYNYSLSNNPEERSSHSLYVLQWLLGLFPES